ncbi:hypothetical protein PAXINDRAFT_37588, partial [Paxillus involutus ATCC 200175]
VLDILWWERLYLSEMKLHFLCHEMKLFSWIIDDQGIQMDSDKVDQVVNWKTPVNWDTVHSFISVAGY